MRYNEYTIPVETVVDEAPMGFIKQGVNKLASKIPGSIGAKASGSLETGSNANAMYKEFYNYLGKTGQQPTTASVSAFLQSKGVGADIIKKYVVAPAGSTANYPQGGAEQPAAAPTGGEAPPVQSPAASPTSGKAPPVQSPAGGAPAAKKPRAPRPKNPAAPAAAAPAAPAPAAPQQGGFKVNVGQTPAQKKTADLLRAAKATRISEDTGLVKLLSKITKRL